MVLLLRKPFRVVSSLRDCLAELAMVVISYLGLIVRSKELDRLITKRDSASFAALGQGDNVLRHHLAHDVGIACRAS
jgi:hypothetical protein